MKQCITIIQDILGVVSSVDVWEIKGTEEEKKLIVEGAERFFINRMYEHGFDLKDNDYEQECLENGTWTNGSFEIVLHWATLHT